MMFAIVPVIQNTAQLLWAFTKSSVLSQNEWKEAENYSSNENTWEPPENLPEDLITAFENMSVDPLRADECIFLISF